MVEFKLTKEQLLAKELFRSFAENEIKPISRDMDEAEKFDMDLLDKMKKYGLMGIPYSKEYGGEGADVLTYALAMEEVSKVDASAGITISVHTSLCCSCINDYASEEQKQKFLRPLVDGSKIGCFGLTEPGAGTDASGVKTTAKLDGDHYVLNGQKVFTTNSGFADTFIIFAYTDKSAIGQIKKRGAKHIKFIGLVAAPQGLKALHEAHPDVDIYVGALDEKLNDNGYIVPGLGDAGDRIFGTK